MIGWRKMMAGILLAVACSNSLQAQTADSASVGRREHSALLGVWKWSTLALSAGAAAYGFVTNRQADNEYRALEEMCNANRLNCIRRSGEVYADAELERRYQDVKALDQRARTALIGSQLGIATSVVLFILDLRDAGPARNIPYEPRALQVMPGRGGSTELRVTLPLDHARK